MVIEGLLEAGTLFECVFRGHSATDFTLIRPPISRAFGHPFHGHSATRFTAIRPPRGQGVTQDIIH
ncbi:hypothetical protein BI364_13060 [Acidihalobacter yilgarnensis]|uniref:Uncharacterized protein n=1 Tax=Acidihalobacter yilgarnensis TaxID=2819280 RepID=A0A1D8IQM9_9GAMM|nr:hypothetical protein BI364_13060 [Acidihalobacter yilgarnensis]